MRGIKSKGGENRLGCSYRNTEKQERSEPKMGMQLLRETEIYSEDLYRLYKARPVSEHFSSE